MICVECNKLALKQQVHKCSKCSNVCEYREHKTCLYCSNFNNECMICGKNLVIKDVIKQTHSFYGSSSGCKNCGK